MSKQCRKFPGRNCPDIYLSTQDVAFTGVTQKLIKRPKPFNAMSDQKKLTSLTVDIEMQRLSRESVTNNLECTKALQSLFGCSAEQIQRLPSIMTWCRYLEERFLPLLGDNFVSMWMAIGLSRPRTAADCWKWFAMVTTSIVQFDDAGASIEDIWEMTVDLCMPERMAAQGMIDSEKSACLIAVFAVLCWGSMSLSPQLVVSDLDASNRLSVLHLQPNQGLKMDFVERPISAVFRHLQRARRSPRWQPPIGLNGSSGNTVLYVSSLNFGSLKALGRVRLQWVNDIDSHLDFNARSRTLSVFRHPSFCALTALGDNRGLIFEE